MTGSAIYALIGIACIAAGLGLLVWLYRTGERDDRRRNLAAEWVREQRERWGR